MALKAALMIQYRSSIHEEDAPSSVKEEMMAVETAEVTLSTLSTPMSYKKSQNLNA